LASAARVILFIRISSLARLSGVRLTKDPVVPVAQSSKPRCIALGREAISSVENKERLNGVRLIMKRSLFTTLFSGLSLSAALLGTTSKADGAVTVYTMDNAIAANHVLMFQQQNGKINAAGSIATGGAGSGGGGLPSQGAIQLSPDGQWLFVCNPGSSEISVFKTGPNGLALSDKVNSGGENPVSLALRNNLLYVVNAGGSVGGTDNITAFTFAGGRQT
jgi:hypothetical protein